MALTEEDRRLVHEIARRRGENEEMGRQFAAAALEARKRAGSDRFCVTDRQTGEHLYCVGGCGQEQLTKHHKETTPKEVKKTMNDVMSPDLPGLMADLRATDLTALAKRMQEPNESFEAAFDRALLTEEGSQLYDERRDWLRKDISVKRTSRDVEGVRKAMDARQTVASAIEEKAAKSYPSISRPEAVAKFLETPEGAAAYERHRAVR